MFGGTTETVMFAEPLTDVYPVCVELAVQLAVPPPEGVKTPSDVTVPPVADQVTSVVNAPVPVTVAAQVEVWSVVMFPGAAITETPVTVGATATATDVEPALVESWVEVAVIIAVPTPDGVKTPAPVIAPPVAAQLTVLL
jgi:hypothetical protein